MRYPFPMNAQRHPEATTRDLTLGEACACCGGPIEARFAPGSARGVCLTCHLVSPMVLLRSEAGVAVVQAPGAIA